MNRRDEAGWRVPRPCTLSSAIYRLAKNGNSSGDIVRLLEAKPNSVRVLLHRVKNPRAHRRRQTDCRALDAVAT